MVRLILSSVFRGYDSTIDENVDLQLSNIVVATVDEPSGFASLATGLVVWTILFSRFRRRGARSSLAPFRRFGEASEPGGRQ